MSYRDRRGKLRAESWEEMDLEWNKEVCVEGTMRWQGSQLSDQVTADSEPRTKTRNMGEKALGEDNTCLALATLKLRCDRTS
jgi:hypothetical protein